MANCRFAGAALFMHALAVFAQSTASSSATTTSATVASSCTASLVTSLCSCPTPGPEFAVAEDSTASCWNYCNANPPCDFVIFAAGNPTTGSGTCWLYPGQSFDASAGGSDCGSPYLSVYDQPTCTSDSGSQTTSGACSATATPSAVAEVCGYPTPAGDCFDGCTASTGASDCLSQCANAAECSYVVFNPHNPSNSPYASGTCWLYPNGTYDATVVSACTGAAEQYVYQNPCPKPKPSSTAASVSGSAAASGSGNGSVTTRDSASSSAGSSSEGTALEIRSKFGLLSWGMTSLLIVAFLQ